MYNTSVKRILNYHARLLLSKNISVEGISEKLGCKFVENDGP